MPKYAAATVDVWDKGWGASTNLQTPPRIAPFLTALTATTTPTPAKEVSVWIRGAVLLPKWFELARDALNELSALPANWNSYAAREIDINAITGAVELLLGTMAEETPLPTFVPVSRGGVLLEWHTVAADLEVTVLPNGKVHVVFEKLGAAPIEIQGVPQEVAVQVKAFLQEI